MYGTTSCEAVHGELARFFRGTTQQRQRAAVAMVKLFCVRSMIAGSVQRLTLSKAMHPCELLHLCAEGLGQLRFDWSDPALTVRFASHVPIDVNELPASAKLASVQVGKRRRIE